GLETLYQTDTRIVLDPTATDSLTDRLGFAHSGTSVCLLIGPEGGLSERDFLLTDKAGFERVKLGPRVLRVETAAIAACTIAQANWGDLLETPEA
ncbi:MAG: RNA methyltransferase, partial [Gammaproteobacteria bacterium]|nr:RNA methyltransferase [Gammaproteobacteria bacterium]